MRTEKLFEILLSEFGPGAGGLCAENISPENYLKMIVLKYVSGQSLRRTHLGKMLSHH
jgi:hypothetical protein